MTRPALAIEVGKSAHKLYMMGKTYNTDEQEFTRQAERRVIPPCVKISPPSMKQTAVPFPV